MGIYPAAFSFYIAAVRVVAVVYLVVLLFGWKVCDWWDVCTGALFVLGVKKRPLGMYLESVLASEGVRWCSPWG